MYAGQECGKLDPCGVYPCDTEKKMYKAKLHAGEVEVMILAQEQKADLVII